MDKNRAAEPWREPLHDPGPVVIFDIDGVLADLAAFEYLVDADRAADKDWKAFHGNFRNASVISSGITALKKIYFGLDIDVAYSTTRREQYARLTLWWLHYHQMPMGPMQLRQFIKDGPRPAIEIKIRHWRDWQRKYADQNPVLAWIDDDPQALRALRAHGCPAWAPLQLRKAELAKRSLRRALDDGPIPWDVLAANEAATLPQWQADEEKWQAKRSVWWEKERRRRL